MNPKCIQEVTAAVGRALTKAEIQMVEDGLARNMRQLARTDPTWRAKSGNERLQAAADAARQEGIDSANKAAERRAHNILAQARESDRLVTRAKELAARGKKNPMHAALFERMRVSDDYVSGIRNEALSDMLDAIDAVSPRGLGWFDDLGKVAEFARAVMDGKSTDPEMVKAAKAYTESMESLRLRANAAGADIGKLDYGYLPQVHDVGKIANAGQDKWVQAVLPILDRQRYIKADGSAMGDAEVIDLLKGAWESISTEGRNKRVPGKSAGNGSRAASFDEKHRAIHFKDADSYLGYLNDYGRASMMTAIHGHVGQMAKTIGLMEEFGSNPNSTVRLLKDMSEKADNTQGARYRGATVDMVWDTLNGTSSQPVSAELAKFWQGIRNVTTAAKLQGVMLSAITDAPLQVLVAKSAGMPTGQAIKSLFTGWGAHARETSHALGIGLDEVAGEMARWHQNNLAQGWSAKLANTTMRLTMVEAWTNSLRRGLALNLSNTLDRMVKTDWSALDKSEQNRFQSGGITEDDWKIWQLAQPSSYRGMSMLTKEGLAGIDVKVHGLTDAQVNRSMTRLLGFLDQEAKTAVLAPDIVTRAAVQQGTKAGTIGGEIWRSTMLFKSFAFAIVDKQLRRIENLPDTKSKVAYSVAMMTSLTLFGALTQQLKAVTTGKDPLDMTKGKFWAAAFLQGGGLGIFGDILYTGMGGNARGGQANWTSLLGPVFGTAADAAAITLGYAGDSIAAKNSAQQKSANRRAASNAIRFARGNLPLINLWYLRAAVDHMALHELQEQVSPGYLRRMKQTAKRDMGSTYWWEPGKPLPARAPSAAAAVGESP